MVGILFYSALYIESILGEWSIGIPSNVVIKDDYGLIVKTKARHHAIAAQLTKPFIFDTKPLIIQLVV